MVKQRIIYQNTGDNPYLYKDDFTGKDIPKLEYEDETLELQKKRRDAISKYTGKNTDKDYWDDGAEIQSSLHDVNNKHQRPINRAGLSTPGPAFAGGGGIQFPYDSSIISLSVKPTHSVIGGVHKMRTPKPMKLSVNFGSKMDHVSSPGGFKINMKHPHPELHTLNTDSVKKMGIRGINNEVKKEKNDIGDLSSRLAGFLNKQKKKSSGNNVKKPSLNFEIVGIKRKKGLLL